MKKNKLILIATIGKPRGLKGEFFLNSFTSPAENIINYSNFLKNEDTLINLKIEYIKQINTKFYSKILDIDNVDDIKKYTNTKLYIDSKELPELPQNQTYWHDLIGMKVIDENLNDEVNKMASQISWGVSFGEVLEMFTERVTSPIVTRAVRMVDEANRAGGRISDILLAASYDAKEIKALETERRQEVGSYVTVIYASFFVYLGIILVLASTFIPAIVDSSATTGGGSMSIGNLTIREMNEVWISTMFLYSLMVQGIGNGLAAGFMSTGRLYSAFLRASFLLFLGWLIFELAGITTSMITPQI